METETTVSKKQKAAKIVSIVINVISIIIMLFAVFIVATSLASKDRGYTAYFNKAYVVVQTNSMAKDLTKWDNFEQGDVIAFKVLSEKDRYGLKINTVITFWDDIQGQRALNTHRIVDARDSDGDGVNDEYQTKGDNNIAPDTEWRKASDDTIQGVYAGKSPFIGKILTYLQSKTGFAIFIVVPCVLIVIYCIVLVVLNIIKYTKSKMVLQHEDDVDALKAELKAQLLKEMEEEKQKKDTDAPPEEKDDKGKNKKLTAEQDDKQENDTETENGEKTDSESEKSEK